MTERNFPDSAQSSTDRRTTGIFLSYRRGDQNARVGRLYDRLVNRFGKERVFRDIDSAVPAANFEQAIDRALLASRVLIAVIGPNWLTVAEANGQRRLDDPKDYVRYEVARALEDRDCDVLPVLRGAATMMPAAGDLPEELRPLVKLQAIRVDEDDEGPHFEFDAQQVVNAVARLLGEPSSRLDPDIVLAPPDLVVEPGQSGHIAVVVRNVGSHSPNVALSYSGPDWARLDPDVESIAAGRELRSALVVSPPRRADVPARAWPYTIGLDDQRQEGPLAQASGSITTAAFRDTRVHLEPTLVETRRTSQLSLAVANRGNVHLYGRIFVKADGLRLEAQDRINLVPGGEQTYPVNASPPRRRVVGRTRNNSLTVSVAIDDEPHPHVRAATIRQRPLLRTTPAIILAAVLIMVLGVGIWSAREAEAAKVPDVTGLAAGLAEKDLKAAGFAAQVTEEETTEVEAGQVIRTEPAPNTEALLDDPITVVIAKTPTVTLRDVTDMTEHEAEATLRADGFTVAIQPEETTDEEAGQVLRTDPPPATELSLGEEIMIVVARSRSVESPQSPPRANDEPAPRTDDDDEAATDDDDDTPATNETSPPTDPITPPDSGTSPPDNGTSPPDNGTSPPDNGTLENPDELAELPGQRAP